MIDLLLVVMAVIWGTNYSIVKFAFHELDPQAFNAARMTIVSVLFLVIIGSLRFGRLASTERTTPDSFVSIFRTPTLWPTRSGTQGAGNVSARPASTLQAIVR